MQNTEEEYLRLFFDVPDLLKLAIEQTPNDRYKVQDELREKYRREGLSFRWSMPLRCFGVCRKCDERFTQVIYELEHPQLKITASSSSTHIHAVQKHGAPMDAKLKQFLADAS